MEYQNIAELSSLQQTLFSNRESNKYCVFISHKKEDELAAIEIGNYLLNTVGINIYLDIRDCTLKEAVGDANDKKIVDSIKKGLKLSTHLLCLISEKTKLSWWVPYEIGIADISNLDIASLKLKAVDDVPSFLRTHKVLLNISDFLQYASGITPLAYYLSENNYKRLTASDNTVLKNYVI